MKKFLIGMKKGMTQVFDTEGRVTPVTVIEIPAQSVTQVKTKEIDGYTAVQLGYGVQKAHRVHQAQQKKGNFKGFMEFRVADTAAFEVGKVVDTTQLAEGDVIQVSGITKGKGFQGVVKRHGFAGGPRSHGQKHSEREPGSIGGGPGRAGGRVVKGLKMAGRMGGERVTVPSLKVVKIDAEKSEVYVRGAVPGRKGTVVELVQK